MYTEIKILNPVQLSVDSRFETQVPGAQVPGLRFQVSGAQVPGVSCQVPGARYQGLDARCQTPGLRF